MLQVVGYGVAVILLALAKEVSLDLRLMVGNRGVLSAPYSVPLLIDSVDQAEGVARRLEVIKFGSVSDLASEVFISAPQYGGSNLK